MRSNTVKNSQNPVFNEEYHLIVDDPDEQSLKITVKDDDFGWSDHVFGILEVIWAILISAVQHGRSIFRPRFQKWNA